MHTERQKGTIYFAFSTTSISTGKLVATISRPSCYANIGLNPPVYGEFLYPADCYPAGWNIYPASNLGAIQRRTRPIKPSLNCPLAWP
jgi:hypothetical protein